MGNSATKTDDTTEYEFIGKPYYEIEHNGTKCEEGTNQEGTNQEGTNQERTNQEGTNQEGTNQEGTNHEGTKGNYIQGRANNYKIKIPVIIYDEKMNFEIAKKFISSDNTLFTNDVAIPSISNDNIQCIPKDLGKFIKSEIIANPGSFRDNENSNKYARLFIIVEFEKRSFIYRPVKTSVNKKNDVLTMLIEAGIISKSNSKIGGKKSKKSKKCKRKNRKSKSKRRK